MPASLACPALVGGNAADGAARPLPLMMIALGKDQVGGVAVAAGLLVVEAPLDAEVAREVPAGDHDARLDLHLGRGAVELGDEGLGLVHVGRQVAHDHRVRALVHVDLAARGEGAGLLEHARDGRGLRVGDALRVVDEIPGERLLLRELPLLLLLPLRGRELGDADDVVLEDVAEAVGLEDEVEGLVPGHLGQLQRDLAAHPGVHDHVEAADVREEPEDVLQVAVLEVQADGRARVLLGPGGGVERRARAAICGSGRAGMARAPGPGAGRIVIGACGVGARAAPPRPRPARPAPARSAWRPAARGRGRCPSPKTILTPSPSSWIR